MCKKNKEIIEKIVYIYQRGFSILCNIIKLNSNIKLNVKIGKHVKLYSKYWIVNSNINDYTYIGPNSNIKNTSIGKFCSIGPNFTCGIGIHPTNMISTSPIFYSTKKQCGVTFAKFNRCEEHKPVCIKNDVFIGVNVTILSGISIGDGAIVAAGSVVTKDVPPYAIVGGIPARVIRFRFDEMTIKRLLKLKWWDFSTANLKDVAEMIDNLPAFFEKYDKNN